MVLHKCFKSVFKIDGVSILPPVIDEERRNELRQLRELAIGVEQRRDEHRKMRHSQSNSHENSTDMQHKIDDIDGNVNDLGIRIIESKCNDNDQQEYSHIETLSSPNDENICSSTIDIIKPIEQLIHRSSPRNLSKEFLSISVDNEATIVLNSNKSADAISTTSSSPAYGNTKDKINTIYLSCHSIPDACTPEPPPRLVRSNSYTLEYPSDVFIKHMELKGIDLCSELSDLSENTQPTSASVTTRTQSIDTPIDRDTDRSKSRRTTPEQTPKPNRKFQTLSASPLLSKIAPNATTNGHNAKIKTPILSKPNGKVSVKKSESREEILKKIYAPQETMTARLVRTKQRAQQLCIITAKSLPTSSKRPKNQQATSTTTTSHSPDIKTLPNKPSKSNFNEYNRLLQLIEERHTRQMNELLQRQQDEQRRLQKEFCQQQDILERQISTMMLMNDPKAERHQQQMQTATTTIIKSTSEQNMDDFYSYKRSHTSIESMDQSSSMCECDETDAECT